MKILIIDDRLDSWNSIRIFLRKAGHVVSAEKSIEAARQDMAENHYDLVLCDGSVDEIGDGMRLAKQLHTMGQKVILCSGEDWPEAAEVPQLPKPIFIDDLEQKISEVMG